MYHVCLNVPFSCDAVIVGTQMLAEMSFITYKTDSNLYVCLLCNNRQNAAEDQMFGMPNFMCDAQVNCAK